MRASRRYHTVALRSTVPPGTVERIVVPLLERASRKKAEMDFGICFHPEFLREGSSVQDFFHPPKTVIGAAGCAINNAFPDQTPSPYQPPSGSC